MSNIIFIVYVNFKNINVILQKKFIHMNIKKIIDAYYKKTYISFDGCLFFCIKCLKKYFFVH